MTSHHDPSEQRPAEVPYREIFEASPLPMWVHDPERGGVVAVNQAAVTLIGKGRDALLAMGVAELEAAATALALQVTAHPVEFDDAVAVLFVANRGGVSPGDSAEFSRVQAWFRKALERAKDALLMVDPDWRVTYMNEEAERVLNQARVHLLGQHLWEGSSLFAGTSIETRIRQAMTEGTPAEFEESLSPKGRTLSIRAYPTVQGLAVFFRDVTERREAERALRESEERFRHIARATADALWDWDLRADTLWWGEGIHAISGFSVDELAPALSSWTDRLHPEDRDRVMDKIQMVIESESTEWEDEYRFRRRDGTYADVADRGFLIRDDMGNPVRMVGGMRDLTESLQAEERLRLQASLLEAVAQSVVATDVEGRVIYWNSSAEELYGWTAEEALGRNVLDVSPTARSREDAAEIMDTLLKGESWTGEMEVRRKDGSTFYALVTDSPIFDATGRVQGIIGLSSDVTERRELEQRFRQAQKMEAVGRLAGGIAHDFNNVLTVILGRARLLLDDLPESSPFREDVDQIIGGAERAASLTSRLLAFGRHQVLQERVVDVSAAAREMEGLLRPLLPERIHLQFETGSKDPCAKVDPVQLQQVLLNLAINARDAIEDAGTITFRAAVQRFTPEEAAAMPWEMAAGPYAVLSVEDTGTGIPPELVDRVFEPFFTTKPEGQGTGLGLSMVYGMMKQSGGHVLVESEVGSGTAFRLLFPLAKEVARPVSETAANAEVPASPRTILVVEDDEAVQNIMRRTLERAGYTVISANDGAEALKRVETDPAAIDLVVSDLVMPGGGGGELLEALRTRGLNVRVVLSTGYSEDELAREARYQASAFLPKPFTPEDLLGVVREILEEGGSAV